MRNLASGRFVVQEKLGAGSFGEIYAGKDTQTGERVAIKLEKVKCKTPQLSFETKLYKIMENGINIAKLHWFGTEAEYNVMVIDLLGKSLEDLASEFHHRLSLKTVLMLVDQMLSAVEYMHSRHLIHRDIKPDNFVMGLGPNANKVYMIDFGLSKKYRDPNTHQHISYKEGKDLTGTARYASVAALKGAEQSRRDDLEALGFVWVYLLKGTLPWMGLNAKNRKHKYEAIYTVKKSTTFEDLCQGLPDEFASYLHAVRRLKFSEEPEYASYRKMFRKLFKRLGYVYDYQYDWSKGVESPSRENKGSLSDRVKRVSQKEKLPVKQSSRSRRDANEGNIHPPNNYSTAVERSKTGDSMASNNVHGHSEVVSPAARYKLSRDRSDGDFAKRQDGKIEFDKGVKVPKTHTRHTPMVKLPRRKVHTMNDGQHPDPANNSSNSLNDNQKPASKPKLKSDSPSDDSSFAFDTKPRAPLRKPKRPFGPVVTSPAKLTRSRSREDSLRHLAEGRKPLPVSDSSDSSYDEFVEQERKRKDALLAKKQNAVTDVEDAQARYGRHSLDQRMKRNESDASTGRHRMLGSPRRGASPRHAKPSVIPPWMIDRVSGK